MYRRPPSTFHSEAIAHQQKGPLQLKKATPQLANIPNQAPIPQYRRLTRSHKVLKMMPLNIVRKVADVDAAVLLRSLPKVLHHLLSGCGALLEGSVGSTAVS